MQRNPVGWFEIYVKDIARSRKFYESVLGVKLEKLDTPAQDVSEMWSFPMERDVPGAAGALVKMPGGPEGGGTSTIVYFSSNDCAIEIKRVAGAGGKVMKDKFSIGPYGVIALFTDPDGNVIGLLRAIERATVRARDHETIGSITLIARAGSKECDRIGGV